jgi:hypothetical protein
VSVGIDHDTARFAVASIRSWWQHLERQRFPDAELAAVQIDRHRFHPEWNDTIKPRT